MYTQYQQYTAKHASEDEGSRSFRPAQKVHVLGMEAALS